ncbi:MAG TPA: hypothetical protein VHU80_23595 [Polyangiaceae bacterium]|jgi:hypothetical protein|nr:hypothetical protein [Polyangiaceae bacterium]
MPRLAVWLPLFVGIGCASILDIDHRYTAGTAASGGESASDASTGAMDATPLDTGGNAVSANSGGALESGGAIGSAGAPPGAGGTTGVGGGPEVGGAGESGGATTVGVADCSQPGNECAKGEKCCGSEAVKGSTCYGPSPLVGCGDTGCDYCSDPVPTNSTPSCRSGACSFTCDPGYVEHTGACVAMGTGGASGSGGKTGTGGSTAVQTCDYDTECTVSCGAAGPFPCCMPNSMCGCTFFNLKVGNLPPIGYCLPRPPQIR